MRRLLARIKGLFKKDGSRLLTRDEALKAINNISTTNGLVYMLFEDKASADQFLAEMRQAHNLMNNLRQSGVTLPPDYSN